MTTEPAPRDGLRAKVPQPVRLLGRLAMASVLGGVLGSAVWLIVVQEGAKRGYTDLDFNHALGELIRGPADEGRVRSEDALGIIGDPIAPTGLYFSLLFGGVLALVHAVGLRLLPVRNWVARAGVLALVTFAAVAFVYAPLISAEDIAPAGVLGLDAGAGTPLVWLAGAIAFGLVTVRVVELVIDARWWRGEAGVAAVEVGGIGVGPTGSSLELGEQGTEKGRIGAGS